MLGGGLGLLPSLEHLTKDESLVFSETVRGICDTLISGRSFSFALKNYSNIFPKVCCDLVAAGEKSGTLHKSLDRLADYLERSSTLEKKFKAAMVYPMVIIILMFIMILVMVWFVFPREKELLESMGAEMPLITRILFDWLGVAFHPGVLLTLFVAGLSLSILYSRNNEGRAQDALKRLIDRNILHLPLIGPLVYKMSAARVLSVFGTLLDSGSTIDQAMLNSAKMMGNTELEERLNLAQVDLLHGYLFSESLQRHKVFPPLAIQLFAVAEESGGLPVMSGRLARMYEEDVESTINTMASLVEPLALIGMGGFVGILLLATLLPTAQVLGNIG